MGFGWTEIILIVVVVLLVFGPKRLPELARGIGKSMAELREGMNEVKSEVEQPMKTMEEEAAGWSRPTDPGAPAEEHESNSRTGPTEHTENPNEDH
jgi:sec-independent protein translocase protein TatA